MHRIFPLCVLFLAADPAMFENPWAEVRLTITRDVGFEGTRVWEGDPRG